MSLRPSLLEQFQRHMVWRHLHPDIFHDVDVPTVNGHYADAVYAPLYYGYGEPGSFADRRERARAWDTELMLAPETVMVLVKASADVIRRRMHESPRVRGILKEPDVELVLDRFDAEYESSLISRRFALDTTSASVEESLGQFVSLMQPHLSEVDLTSMSASAQDV